MVGHPLLLAWPDGFGEGRGLQPPVAFPSFAG
jgi:hypothetical protein